MSTIKVLDDINLDAEDAKALKNMIDEVVNSKYRIQGETSFIKEVRKRAKEELEIPPKLFNQLVKVAFELNAEKINQEVTTLLDLAEQLGYYSHEE